MRSKENRSRGKQFEAVTRSSGPELLPCQTWTGFPLVSEILNTRTLAGQRLFWSKLHFIDDTFRGQNI